MDYVIYTQPLFQILKKSVQDTLDNEEWEDEDSDEEVDLLADQTPEKDEEACQSDDDEEPPEKEYVRIYKETKSQSIFNTRLLAQGALDENDSFSVSD